MMDRMDDVNSDMENEWTKTISERYPVRSRDTITQLQVAK